MVEHSAVNRRVAGSSPARGANSFSHQTERMRHLNYPYWVVQVAFLFLVGL